MSGKSKPAGRVYFPLPDISKEIERDSARSVNFIQRLFALSANLDFPAVITRIEDWPIGPKRVRGHFLTLIISVYSFMMRLKFGRQFLMQGF